MILNYINIWLRRNHGKQRGFNPIQKYGTVVGDTDEAVKVLYVGWVKHEPQPLRLDKPLIVGVRKLIHNRHNLFF